jgi:hypothetical protein
MECLFVPFGTILGVFTFITLSRESVKALFSGALATIPTARRTVSRQNNIIAVQQITEERSDLLPSTATVKFCQKGRASRPQYLPLLTRRRRLAHAQCSPRFSSQQVRRFRARFGQDAEQPEL